MPDNLKYMYAEHDGRRIVVGARRLEDAPDAEGGEPHKRWDITFVGGDGTFNYSPTLQCEFDHDSFRLIGPVPGLYEDLYVGNSDEGPWRKGSLLEAVEGIVSSTVDSVIRAGGGDHRHTIQEIESYAVQDILTALDTAMVHEGQTLSELLRDNQTLRGLMVKHHRAVEALRTAGSESAEALAVRVQHLEGLLAELKKVPEGGWHLTFRPGQVPIVVSEFFEACWPDHIMDRKLLQEPLTRGLPRMLELVEEHATLNGTWALAHCHEAVSFAEEENAALRRNLVWLAGRPEVTPASRRELAARIRDLHGPGYVPENSAEEEEDEVRGYAKLADRACDLIQEVLDWRADRREGAATERKPRPYWDAQAESVANRLREFTPKRFGTTLAGIREIGCGK